MNFGHLYKNKKIMISETSGFKEIKVKILRKKNKKILRNGNIPDLRILSWAKKIFNFMKNYQDNEEILDWIDALKT